MSLLHKIALTLIPNVGHVLAKSLLAEFGSAEAIFAASRSHLLSIDGIGKVTADHILDNNALQLAEERIKALEQQHIQILFYTDEHYPQRLKHCYDSPVLLYYRGTADLNHFRIVSIVGTRMATPYGLSVCRQLTDVLQSYDVLVVSGLAYGIDVAAHKESLRCNIPTVGVLGHGLDRLYPSSHRQIANQMIKSGGLLTEFPLGTAADKENFPKRNRIIAGIADVTIVVQAAMKGGALITADIANSYHRDVFAFPGRITDEFSQGCNFLIKTNRAALLNHAKDLVYYMGWDSKGQPETVQTVIPLNLSIAEKIIVGLLEQSALRIDDLGLKADMAQSKLAVHLLNLEIKGLIICLPGSVYQLV